MMVKPPMMAYRFHAGMPPPARFRCRESVGSGVYLRDLNMGAEVSEGVEVGFGGVLTRR